MIIPQSPNRLYYSILFTFHQLSSSINHHLCPSIDLYIISLNPANSFSALSFQPLSIHLLAMTSSIHPCILSCTTTLLICLSNTAVQFAYAVYIDYNLLSQRMVHLKNLFCHFFSEICLMVLLHPMYYSSIHPSNCLSTCPGIHLPFIPPHASTYVKFQDIVTWSFYPGPVVSLLNEGKTVVFIFYCLIIPRWG